MNEKESIQKLKSIIDNDGDCINFGFARFCSSCVCLKHCGTALGVDDTIEERNTKRYAWAKGQLYILDHDYWVALVL